MKQWRTILDAGVRVALIGVCVIAGWSIWRSHQNDRPASGAISTTLGEAISLEGSHMIGDARAPVVVVEFSDFQCPFCARFSTSVWPALRDEYIGSGKIRWAFRHLPLASIHDSAMRAAISAECADKQGRFWEMHDVMLQNPQQLSESALIAHAGNLGLDTTRFIGCLADSSSGQKIEQDLALATRAGVSSTPSFLVGSVQPSGELRVQRRIAGLVTVAEFRKTLDELLRSQVQGAN